MEGAGAGSCAGQRGKGDVATLVALFVFTVLFITSPSGEGFSLFSVCWKEQKEQHLLSAAFLHQAFLSVSLGKYYSHPLDENLVGQSSKCCQWQQGGEEQGAVQEHPTAWLSISSSDCSLLLSPHSITPTHGMRRPELLVMLVHLPCGGTVRTHWVWCLVGSCHALMGVPSSIPPSALQKGEDIQSSLEQIYHRMMYLCLATSFP